MANWKVSKEIIELCPHPNADNVELLKVGGNQCVVQKGKYQNGQWVIFVPAKSILPDGPLRDEYVEHLDGPGKNIVKTVRLRGEHSAGVVFPNYLYDRAAFEDAEIGENIADRFGIVEYIVPIPSSLAGNTILINQEIAYGFHDCNEYSIYEDEFVEGEWVIVSEKLHGSQAIYTMNLRDGYKFVSSKGSIKRGLCIEERENNAYWQAANNCSLFNLMYKIFKPFHIYHDKDEIVQVFAELINCQKEFDYGQDKLTIRIFDIRINNKSIPYNDVHFVFKNNWVPIIYSGPIRKEDMRALARGNERVSGKGLHIREGVVVAPAIDRLAHDGTRLRVKIINPKYIETGQEFN